MDKKFALLLFLFQYLIYKISSDIWNVDHHSHHPWIYSHDGRSPVPTTNINSWHDKQTQDTIGGHFKCHSLNIFIDIEWIYVLYNNNSRSLYIKKSFKMTANLICDDFFLHCCYDNLFILVWYKQKT